MNNKKVILVTGVGGYWGSRLATRLMTEPNIHVIGLDIEPQVEAIEGLDFVQADIRNPLIAELLVDEGVDTVCHLAFIEEAELSERAFDFNMMGTMKLFGACAEAGVDKVVIKSSTAVYGAHPDNSAYLTEDVPLRGSRLYGYTRDLIEIESFINGFRGQYPESAVTVLRFANIIGTTARTPFTRFLGLQTPPILLGFDPIMQLIHEDDVVEALAFAALNDVAGVYNIGAEGPMPLSRILRLARKVPTQIFHPIAYRGLDLLRSSRFQPLRFVPLEWDYLRYRWVGDLTRMRELLDFSPIYLAEEAIREFTGSLRMDEDAGQLDDLAYDERRLRDIIERRRRAKERRTVADEGL